MRDGAANAHDVGGQRGLGVLRVAGGMIAHDIDDGGGRLLRVVQHGGGVGEARSQMQQCRRRLARHAGIAIGCARRHGLEQAQDTAQPRFAVQRGDKMHFRGARIAQAQLDAAVGQGVYQTFGPIHGAQFKQEGPPRASVTALHCLTALRRSLGGAVLRQKNPARGPRRPQIVTMRHWITSFYKIVAPQP